jgi:hypothetical protein
VESKLRSIQAYITIIFLTRQRFLVSMDLITFYVSQIKIPRNTYLINEEYKIFLLAKDHITCLIN